MPSGSAPVLPADRLRPFVYTAVHARSWPYTKTYIACQEGRAVAYMARPKKPETMDIMSIRLPDGLIEEIDRFTEKLQADTPLLTVGRADTVRYLLKVGLQEVARKGRKPR